MIPAVVKWQIITPQPDVVAAYYKRLFGWSVVDANALGYREMRSRGTRGVDGGVGPSPAGAPSFVRLFVEVADVGVAVAEAAQLGASVLVPRSVLPDGDIMAILVDPAGVSFGLCEERRTGS